MEKNQKKNSDSRKKNLGNIFFLSRIEFFDDSSFFTIDDKIYGVGFNVNGNLGIGSTDNLSVTTELSPVG